MILPWYSKYVGYALIVLLACFYTGVKVASHYEEKLAKIEALGVIQKERVKVIETKQKEVVRYVNRSVSRDIALSNEYYRMLYPGSSEVPNFARTTGGVDEGTKTASPDTSCDPKDGAADAIVILGWQRFYRELKKSQETLIGP